MGPCYEQWGNRERILIQERYIVWCPAGDHCQLCNRIRSALPVTLTDGAFNDLVKGKGDPKTVALESRLRKQLNEDPNHAVDVLAETCNQVKRLSAHVKVEYPLWDETSFLARFENSMDSMEPHVKPFMWENEEGDSVKVCVTKPAEKRRKLVVSYGVDINHVQNLVPTPLHEGHPEAAMMHAKASELDARTFIRADSLMSVPSAEDLDEINKVRAEEKKKQLAKQALAASQPEVAVEQIRSLAPIAGPVRGQATSSR